MRNEEVGAQEAVNVRTIMSSNAAKLGFTLNIKDAKALSRIADCGEAEYCVMGKAIGELKTKTVVHAKAALRLRVRGHVKDTVEGLQCSRPS